MSDMKRKVADRGRDRLAVEASKDVDRGECEVVRREDRGETCTGEREEFRNLGTAAHGRSESR